MAMKKIKIVVVGIGGVGGYFGGLLANRYSNGSRVEVIFLSRGDNLTKIQQNGLKVIRPDREFVAWPHLATENPFEIGAVDYVIIFTKAYDLEETISQLEPCITDETIVLPLLNGVNSKELIKNKWPSNTVLDGCVYIIARLNEPGVVENKGNIQKLFFGLDNYTDKKLELLESVCIEAGIDVTYSSKVSKIIWEKYIFISAMATSTSYFNMSIGQVVAENEPELKKLIIEVCELAKAKKIEIEENIESRTLDKLRSLPFEATSSMHSDIQNGKQKLELDALTHYVIKEGQKLGIQTPVYLKMYNVLKELR